MTTRLSLDKNQADSFFFCVSSFKPWTLGIPCEKANLWLSPIIAYPIDNREIFIWDGINVHESHSNSARASNCAYVNALHIHVREICPKGKNIWKSFWANIFSSKMLRISTWRGLLRHRFIRHLATCIEFINPIENYSHVFWFSMESSGRCEIQPWQKFPISGKCGLTTLFCYFSDTTIVWCETLRQLRGM